jgi:uncharacterized membrane protein YdjX (TVP38/TMEM64 family)
MEEGLTVEAPARRIPWKRILIALAVLALIVFIRRLPLPELLGRLNEWVTGMGAAGVFVYAAIYAVAAVLFVPGSLLTLGAGFLFGVVWGTICVSLASTTSAAVAFLIARYLAREKVSVWAKRNPKFAAVDAAIGQQGWKIVALLRLSPLMPFSIGNYLYGLTAVRFWPYVLASWIAMLPITVLYVYVGAVGRAGLEAAAGQGPARDPLQVVFWIVGLIATGVATWLVTRTARRALAEARLAEAAARPAAPTS